VLLVLAPLLVLAYRALVRRRAERTAALAAQGFVPTAGGRRLHRVRHVPFVCFLGALVLLLVGLARPEMTIGLPHEEGTVILAFDVSNSMRAEDLQPTRMDAAKAAARAFVEQQPDSLEIGVVAFSDGGLVTQVPTTVKVDVLAAIDRLSPIGATSLGQGIFASLNAIAGKPVTVDPANLDGELDNLDIGYYGSAAVVLLSDGENTADPDPLEVAEVASVAGVKIYPIGIGSPAGTVVDLDGFSAATRLDPALLGAIAEQTGGTYSEAADAKALEDVYDQLDLRMTTEPEPTEVTALFTAAAIALLLVGGALSLLWFGRLV
jgi:Ca-activated chloride channel family protein